MTHELVLAIPFVARRETRPQSAMVDQIRAADCSRGWAVTGQAQRTLAAITSVIALRCAAPLISGPPVADRRQD